MPEEEEEDEHSELTDRDTSTEINKSAEEMGDVKEISLNVAQESTPSGEIVVEQQSVTADVLRPDLSEVRKENNRDTMSYLKAKRIIRHKSNEVNDAKKFKSSD